MDWRQKEKVQLKVRSWNRRLRGLYLTVSDLRVAVSVRGEDAPESGDARGVLESRMVWQGTVQVPLNLLCGQVALTHGFLHQAAVVALVGLQL